MDFVNSIFLSFVGSEITGEAGAHTGDGISKIADFKKPTGDQGHDTSTEKI
jgi:hypothetical protein